MCKVLKVHPSGYYKWLHQPISDRDIENQKLLVHIKEAYKESGGVYGHRNIHKAEFTGIGISIKISESLEYM